MARGKRRACRRLTAVTEVIGLAGRLTAVLASSQHEPARTSAGDRDAAFSTQNLSKLRNRRSRNLALAFLAYAEKPVILRGVTRTINRTTSAGSVGGSSPRYLRESLRGSDLLGSSMRSAVPWMSTEL